MKTLLLHTVVLLSAAFAQAPAPTAPQAAVPPAQPIEQQKPGVIEGRVLNAKTGEPVRRVNLTLRPFNPAVPSPMFMGAAPSAPYGAVTDAEGKFRIEKVEPGQYRLAAERQGFVRQEYGAGASMMGTTLRILPGQELKDIQFKLLPQGIITGRIFDEEGEPIARAQVQLLRQRYVNGKRQLAPASMAQSLDTGEFRAADLLPGRYWVSAVYRNRMFAFEGPTRNATDKQEQEYVTTYYPGATDADAARSIDLAPGQEVPGIDIRMQKAPVYRVRGKVTGLTAPAQNVRLILMPRDRSNSVMMMMGGNSAAVKEDGSFEIASVLPGAYFIGVFPMQGVNVGGKVAVDVGHQNVDDVTLPLAAGSSVTGSIRIDGDVQQLQQAQGKQIPLNLMRVQVVAMEGVQFNAPNSQVKPDGTFALENVAPDRYRVTVMGIPPGLWLKSIRSGEQEILESGLTVGGATSAQIILGVGTGQLNGVVIDAKQQPAPGAMVTLLPDPMKEGRMDLHKVTTTTQAGQFTLQGIAPGEYKIYAWQDVEPGAYLDPELLKLHESRAQKITIKANDQQQVSLTQVPAAAP